MTNYDDMSLKEGQLIVFSEGEYSSYMYNGHYKVLRDANLQGLANTYKEQFITVEEITTYNRYNPDGYTYKRYTDGGVGFYKWLVETGFIIPLAVTEFYKQDAWGAVKLNFQRMGCD